MNVLLVDDYPNFCRVTATAFRLLGCRAFIAHTSASATQVMATERIDAMFLDVNLGGESGLEFLSQVGALPDAPPVIMFTGVDPEEIAEEARQRGAFGCLPKLATMEELREQLARIDKFHAERAARPNS